MKTLRIELTSASKYSKGTRLLIKIKKEAFLGTVTTTRQGEIFVLLDNGEKVKVKERSKLILGEGIKRKVKKPINIDSSDYMSYLKDGKGISKVINKSEKNISTKKDKVIKGKKAKKHMFTRRNIHFPSDDSWYEFVIELRTFLASKNFVKKNVINKPIRHTFESLEILPKGTKKNQKEIFEKTKQLTELLLKSPLDLQLYIDDKDVYDEVKNVYYTSTTLLKKLAVGVAEIEISTDTDREVNNIDFSVTLFDSKR